MSDYTGPTGIADFTGPTGIADFTGPTGIADFTGPTGTADSGGPTGPTGSPEPFNGVLYIQFYRWGNNSSIIEKITPASLDARVNKDTPVDDSPINSHRAVVYVDDNSTMMNVVNALGFTLNSVDTIYNQRFGLYVPAGVTNFLTSIHTDPLLTVDDLSKPLKTMGISGDSMFELYV